MIIKLSCIEYKFRLVLLAFDTRTNLACQAVDEKTHDTHKRYTKTTNDFQSSKGELKAYFRSNFL